MSQAQKFGITDAKTPSSESLPGRDGPTAFSQNTGPGRVGAAKGAAFE